MMHSYPLLLLLIFGSASSEEVLSPQSSFPRAYQDSSLEGFVKKGEYKSAEEVIQKWVSTCRDEHEKAFLLVEKAKILFADQQHTEAQETFLEALQQLHSSHEPDQGEQEVCQLLYPSYEELTYAPEKSSSFEQKAIRLQADHPSYQSLKLFTAVASANRGQMIAFFDQFFAVFKHWPDWFLSWKIRGVLHLRLFEATADEKKRIFHRSEAVHCFQEAFSLRPNDASLLLKLLFVLPVEEKKELLRKVVDRFVGLDTPPRRFECFYLIEQAFDARAFDVAEKLITRARSWYQYSRSLDEFSQRLAEAQ